MTTPIAPANPTSQRRKLTALVVGLLAGGTVLGLALAPAARPSTVAAAAGPTSPGDSGLSGTLLHLPTLTPPTPTPTLTPPTPTATTTPTYTWPAGGAFVVGDLEAGVGNNVLFWGAQWVQNNPMTTGDGPHAFKGFVNRSSTNPPTCGSTWATDPGNSSDPPQSIPATMALIVASHVDKNGPVISGDVRQIVVVTTQPGYGPNPGHAGTGTIQSIVCQ